MIVLFLIIHIFHVIYVLNTNIVYIKARPCEKTCFL